MGTKTRFEGETKGNSEMAYCVTIHRLSRKLPNMVSSAISQNCPLSEKLFNGVRQKPTLPFPFVVQLISLLAPVLHVLLSRKWRQTLPVRLGTQLSQRRTTMYNLVSN